MGLFRTTICVMNGVLLTNANTLYVHTVLGNDTTGNGTRENPYATITKAIQLSASSYILLNGFSNENLAGSYFCLIGDTDTSGMISWAYSDNNTANINIVCTGSMAVRSSAERGCRISLIPSGNMLIPTNSTSLWRFKNNFVSEIRSSYYSNIDNCTFLRLLNHKSTSGITIPGDPELKDCIFSNSVDLYNYTSMSAITAYPIFKNCLFRKATLWKWNTATITINWTNNPVGGAAYDTDVTLMTRVYNSLLFYANSLGAGTNKTYFLAILATQGTMFKECVVWDDSDTVNNPIFSRYVDGEPVDYTLALKSNNPALYMSTTGSYVGCYAANVNDDGHGNHITFGAVKHVDETTGLDTATAPDLLIQDPSNPAKFSASQTSLQLWNRIRTSVVEYPRGKSFAGMQSQLDSGIASRLFFGKRQEIRTTGDISQKTTAFESVEVIPYDSLPDPNTVAENDITGLSATLPRFSAPFNGECLLFYKGGNLLKFNDYNGLKTLFTGQGTVAITSGSAVVTGTSTAFTVDFVKDDNIRIAGVDYKVLSVASNTSLTLTTNSAVTLSAQTYQVGVTVDKSYAIYGNWVVSNADIESYSLLLKTAKAGLTTSIPLIKWCKFELNLHYDEQ